MAHNYGGGTTFTKQQWPAIIDNIEDFHEYRAFQSMLDDDIQQWAWSLDEALELRGLLGKKLEELQKKLLSPPPH